MSIVLKIGSLAVTIEKQDNLDDAPPKTSVPESDLTQIKRALKLLAGGGAYGIPITISGIGLAAFFAGWLGLAVVLTLVVGPTMFILGIKQVDKIFPSSKPQKTGLITLLTYLGYIGVLLLFLGITGLVDKIPFSPPKPTPDQNWLWELITGLIFVSFWILFLKTRHEKPREPNEF